ncbi:MAG: vitamin K epoxide reductase family protein [Planctomycetota bacterium]
MTDGDPQPDALTAASGRGVRWRWSLALGLAVVAAGLSGYLLVATLAGDGRPAGCGGAGGCGAVLSSKWSKVVGLPVSGLAVGVYVVVIAALLRQGRTGGVVLAACAAAVLGAGAWFMWVQLAVVGAICAWCTAAHATGAAMAVTLLIGAAARAVVPGAMAGLLGVAAVAAVQYVSDEPVFLVEDGGGQRDGQTLTLLDGRLVLELSEEMVVGDLSQLDAEGGRVIVKMSDHNCPHCRNAHHVLKELPGAGVAVVLLPVPMNPACNAHQAELPLPQFAESCRIAAVAWAVHRTDPGALPTFEAWAYGDGWPHTAAEAEAFAATLIDPRELAAALDNPAAEAVIRRNTEAWGQAKAADLVGGLPVHLVPGGGLTYGGVGDGLALQELLDGVHFSQTESGENENDRF